MVKMSRVNVIVQKQEVGHLFYEKERDTYGFNYSSQIEHPVSLTMPYRPSSYLRSKYLPPIFDMNMPEGYLFEVLKNHLLKQYDVMNDFLVFSFLSNNIEGRLTYQSQVKAKKFAKFELDDILKNDNEDTFLKLVKTYLGKNAISGILECQHYFVPRPCSINAT